MHLISSHFEMRSIDDHMSLDKWRMCLQDLFFVLRILGQNEKLKLIPIQSQDSFEVCFLCSFDQMFD